MSVEGALRRSFFFYSVMYLDVRIKAAARAAFLHFIACAVVAVGVAWVIFGVWYPDNLQELTGGSSLFLILMTVDVICGPVLTLVLFNPAKSRDKWRIDLGLIVLIQFAALVFGLIQVSNARPVFLAYEGDRFRVVQALDISADRLSEAPSSLQTLSYAGPKIIGVRLAKSGDADHLVSVQMSVQGMHPAFRPSRWQSYESQVPEVLSNLKPIEELRSKNPGKLDILGAAMADLSLGDEQVGYLPLVRDVVTDWVILVERTSGVPRAYLHLDGW